MDNKAKDSNRPLDQEELLPDQEEKVVGGVKMAGLNTANINSSFINPACINTANFNAPNIDSYY